jgi:hypothetical protein
MVSWQEYFMVSFSFNEGSKGYLMMHGQFWSLKYQSSKIISQIENFRQLYKYITLVILSCSTSL